ncbi:hypothetical protein [Nocardioides sp.]|uniref:hypothetical protein n=1 Tax=Nocardioides sp. TaxID=35761 RepID=UPI0039E4915C
MPSHVDPRAAEQRIVEAAVRLPSGGAVTGWAGLRWGGGAYFGGHDPAGGHLPVPLALDNHRKLRPQPGVELCEEFLAVDDITRVDGLPVTVHPRSVCRILRTTPSLERRVAALDMAAFYDLCSLQEVLDYARARLAGRPHVTRIWSALPHASENSWSPREPVMRLIWTRVAGLPEPLVNVPLFDRWGSHLVTPDLLDPATGVVGEYDGAQHGELRPRERDLGREELYRDLGLELVTMVSADNRDRDGFVRRLRSAYDRASRRPRSAAWTLQQPHWWVDTSTVARRRALDEEQRRVWLRRQQVAA